MPGALPARGEGHLGSGAGRVVGAANLVLAAGIALLASAAGRWWFLAVVGVVVFTLAELVWSPFYDALVPDFAAPLEPMVGFGLAALGWGLAESLGAAVGTALVAHGARPWPAALAFLVGAAAVVAAGAVSVLGALRPDPSTTSARPLEVSP